MREMLSEIMRTTAANLTYKILQWPGGNLTTFDQC